MTPYFCTSFDASWCWKSFRWFATCSWIFCHTATAWRRRCDPFLRRATRRCALRSCACAFRYHLGFLIGVPSERTAKESKPTSTPISSVDSGNTGGATSHEKHAYHDPQIRLRNSVPCFSGSLRCIFILMLPTFEIATWFPCTWNAAGVNTRLLKRLRPLNPAAVTERRDCSLWLFSGVASQQAPPLVYLVAPRRTPGPGTARGHMRQSLRAVNRPQRSFPESGRKEII